MVLSGANEIVDPRPPVERVTASHVPRSGVARVLGATCDLATLSASRFDARRLEMRSSALDRDLMLYSAL
jgi:hypothetical protein